jgi:hypothetical protein
VQQKVSCRENTGFTLQLKRKLREKKRRGSILAMCLASSNAEEIEMMRRLSFVRACCIAAVAPLCVLTMCAQDSTRVAPQVQMLQQDAGPVGHVTGTVIDQDTQRPVRLANVMLVAMPVANESRNGGLMRFSGSRGGSVAKTGPDGTYAIETTGSGDFFVLATAAGYVSQRALLQAQFDAGAKAEDLVKQIPMVHVSANGEASATVVLQHGGALGGRLQWDDGSAAAGVSVLAESTVKPQTMPLPLSLFGGYGGNAVEVDDRGEFRLNGLASGDYYISAIVQSGASRDGYVSTIHVYAPGVFRKADAKLVTVRVGDERDDLQMVIDLSSLRMVSGSVGSSSGTANVKSGSVTLQDSVDPSLQLAGAISADGSFSLKFVPPGTYTMTVQGSSSERTTGGFRRGGSSSGGATFQTYTQTLAVGSADVTGLEINLAATSK